MSNIAVSVIVPVYNVENYLEKCLDSLLNQTLKNIEIICINDGSKDNSGDILKKYASIDNRIIVKTQENAGLSAARNAGLEIAQGEYIGFVDSDDWVDLDFYEKLYNTAKKHGANLAITSILKHKNDNKRYNVVYKKEIVADNLKDKLKLCEDNKHRIFYVWNKIYKKELIKNNNLLFPNGRVFEDVLFNTKSIFYTNKVVSVTDTKYHYIERCGSIINSKDKTGKKKNDHDIAYEQMQDFAKENNFQLPERLNYTKTYWKGFLKVYEGKYKIKYLLFSFIPVFIKNR